VGLALLIAPGKGQATTASVPSTPNTPVSSG